VVLALTAALAWIAATATPAAAQETPSSPRPGLTLFRDGASPYRPEPGSSAWIRWEPPRVELYPERPSPYPFVRTDADPVRLEILGGVSAPLGIDLTLRLAILDHLLITASAGAVTFGGAARNVAMGYVSEEAANSALLVDGALMLRVGIGARIVEGLELVGGYATLHRELTVRSDFLELLGVTGITHAEGRVTLEALWLELGWTFTILDHFLVRPAVGVMHVLDAHASLVGEGVSANEAAYLDRTARTVETNAEAYGTSPTLSLTLGYRL
jgi:hypothetical protein